MARVVEPVGARPTNFTFDVGGLDLAFAPGTGMLVPASLSSDQAQPNSEGTRRSIKASRT
ncbi:arginase family protein [Burkholderia sp. BE17]|uniref:arginase family protein n=1 Tax=Burkholderia sp. BE17 TaxID=2656644 RepID=UPI0039EDE987